MPQNRLGNVPVIDLPLSGVTVTPMDVANLHRWITETVEEKIKAAILAHNLHSLYVWEVNSAFRHFYKKADVVLTDGFPVLKLAKWRSGLDLTLAQHRIGTLDWLPGLMQRTPVRRVAVVGATPEGNARTVSKLQSVDQEKTVVGWPGEGWNDGLETQIVADLQSYQPDFVIVGLGMPLQEEFLHRRWDQLPTAIYAAVGGGIDEYSGVMKPPPRWLGRYGLEWAYRVVTQPRRLSYRYLVEPWKLAFLLVRKSRQRGQQQ